MLKLGADLFLRLDPFLQSAPEVRVPRREVARIGDAGRLPGVDDEETLGMLDDPGVNGQPVASGHAGEGPQQAQRSMALASDLVGTDADDARLNRLKGDAARGRGTANS
jgi:hypothetical protein